MFNNYLADKSVKNYICIYDKVILLKEIENISSAF